MSRHNKNRKRVKKRNISAAAQNKMNITQGGISENKQLCYESVNNSCHKGIYSVHAPVIIYSVMWTTIVVTVCGNLLVIISISHFKQLHTPTNFLVLSLAVIDLLLGGFVMPPIMARIAETCWYFGEVFCKVHLSSAVMFSTASIIHLSLISIDRYFAVCHPLRYKTMINAFLTVSLILISWILSAILGFIILFLELNLKGLDEEYIQKIKCVGSCFLVQNEISGLLSSLFSFYIPGFVMICIYMKIFSVARRQARSIRDTAHQTTEEKRSAASSKRERKATKTLAIVLGVFLICWLPFFLCNVISPLVNHMIPSVLIEFFTWIGYMNSTFNPLIYGFFYSWFRKALKLIAFGKIFQSDSSRTKLFTD
ncbi:trace amine-associated receptor 1-like [Polypterus senegalus]|uniref:trace amine-associated receptor 1-like n=1 Tax=Polypterus senegalus TaxID=55291 RepID=UPI00196444F2|nr:trace amine-associated receptor 1-like [Polypterus senegalus]